MPTDNPITETHPLEPFLPANARLLMLGSFPPKRERWSMDWYYPNAQNDMWRIFGVVFFGDKDHFIVQGTKKFDKDLIVSFCAERGIALSDTAAEVKRLRDNASDKFLEITRPRDIKDLLGRIPACTNIAATGQKAMDTLLLTFDVREPATGHFSEFEFEGKLMRLYRMPSSSRAYPKPLQEKAAVYAEMFRQAGLLKSEK